MGNRLIFNPITASLDYVDDEVHTVASPSTTSNVDFEVIADGSTNGVVYFWVNGHRFKLTGTVDDPIIASNTGQPMGLLLALTHA